LVFTSTANAALAHEARCAQVFGKFKETAGVNLSLSNKSLNDKSVALSSTNAPLVAWGSSADKRWREILQIVESESPSVEPTLKLSQESRISESEEIDNSGASLSRQRQQRPLLLFFPQHNESKLLGCYRALILFER
jgi:hypothetical protein